MKQRNEMLNIVEAIASFLVVCIHFPVPGNGEVTAIARISVPLFFSISGYFFYMGNSEAERNRIPGKVKNLLGLILLSEFSYFSFYTMLQMRHVGFSVQAVKNLIEAEILNVYCPELVERVTIFAPPFNCVCWFVGSLIVVYLVIRLVIQQKLFGKFLIWSVSMIPVSVLIRRLFLLCDRKDLLLDERLLPLIPLPFFALGYLMRKHQKRLWCISSRACIVLICMGAALTLLENRFESHTLYIGTVLMVPTILLLCVKHADWMPKTAFGCLMSHIGGKTSTYIYLFHILVSTVVGVVVDGVLPGIRENVLCKTVYPILIFAASAVFAELIYQAKLLFRMLMQKINPTGGTP